MTDWWTTQTGTLIGAFGGAGIGVVGGCFGAAVGVLAPRGIAKKFVLTLHAALVCIGVLTLIAAIVALVTSQPYHVVFPLALIGFITTVVLGPLYPVVLLRYRQAEHRKLEAEQLRRA